MYAVTTVVDTTVHAQFFVVIAGATDIARTAPPYLNLETNHNPEYADNSRAKCPVIRVFALNVPT